MLTSLDISKAAVTIKIIMGAILISALAQINIPIEPVPITLHTIAASLIAFRYSPKESISSWILYLSMGVMGLPVFTNFSYGIEKLLGPNSGYYYGMMFGSYLISYLRTKYNISLNYIRNILSLLLALHVIIFTSGLLVLSSFIGFEVAIFSGFLIFIPTGILKSLIFGLLYRLSYEKTI